MVIPRLSDVGFVSAATSVYQTPEEGNSDVEGSRAGSASGAGPMARSLPASANTSLEVSGLDDMLRDTVQVLVASRSLPSKSVVTVRGTSLTDEPN